MATDHVKVTSRFIAEQKDIEFWYNYYTNEDKNFKFDMNLTLDLDSFNVQKFVPMVEYQLPSLNKLALKISNEENQHLLNHLSHYLPERVTSLRLHFAGKSDSHTENFSFFSLRRLYNWISSFISTPRSIFYKTLRDNSCFIEKTTSNVAFVDWKVTSYDLVETFSQTKHLKTLVFSRIEFDLEWIPPFQNLYYDITTIIIQDPVIVDAYSVIKLEKFAKSLCLISYSSLKTVKISDLGLSTDIFKFREILSQCSVKTILI